MSTILCIDDDLVLLNVQKKVLETNGYTVLTAPDGPTGIDLASVHAVDLVVLDFVMPGMNGDEVAQALWEKQPELPIVICTGFFDATPEWLKWFAAGYVDKGNGPKALLSTIHDVIAGREALGDPAGAGPHPRAA